MLVIDTLKSIQESLNLGGCHCEEAVRPWQSQPLNLNLVVYKIDRALNPK